MSLIITRPSIELLDKIEEYRQEFFNYGEKHINGSYGLAYYRNIQEWLDIVLSIESNKLSRDNVHATTFFSIRLEDNKIIGSIQLRHSLTDSLNSYGGHIGYGIRPSERRMGYATEQLRLVLEEAKNMNLPKVMITCNKDNKGSAKVIMKNKGVLENEIVHQEEMIQIYWINLL